MEPILALSAAQNAALMNLLETVESNPYLDYPRFATDVNDLSRTQKIPGFFTEACQQILTDRTTGNQQAHVIANCPIDRSIPVLGNDDPVSDKYLNKKTFVGEAFLALFAVLTESPLLAYADRFKGDFFTDVIAITRFAQQQTGYAEGEVVYHNDRSAHAVRADYISLLGMRCPTEDLVYTGFVSGKSLLEFLDARDEEILRQDFFMTPFDVVSRERTPTLESSPSHPILSDTDTVRYVDTHTTVSVDAPVEAKDALLALKNALTRVPKIRHRMQAGDLLTFANQRALHNRERIEVTDPVRARTRWLLKTYAFANEATANKYGDFWVDGVVGVVGDTAPKLSIIR
jgi:L-asparagine oxygenase